MKKHAVDTNIRQFSKKGEDICGDAVKVVRMSDSTIIVMSDGLGSGVKANVLATLTVELASGLFKGDISLLEIVETLIATLPVCKWRNIAYSTFSIIRIYDTGRVTVVECDTPSIIRVKEGVAPEAVSGTEHEILNKTVRELHFTIESGDTLLIFTDGIVYAGVGEGLPMGWQEEGILRFVAETAPKLDGDCSQLVDSIADKALEYWAGRPGDDGTVVCARYRKARMAVLLTGPPADRSSVPKMLRDFLSRDGMKIVSGGTTSHLVADHLSEQLTMDERFLDTDLPPTGKIPGIDLVTEGILTLSRAVDYLSNGVPSSTENAATELIDRLMQADGIVLMVGMARNPAHQNTGLPDSMFLRRRIAEDLAAQLRKHGKDVEMVHY